jgi:hypothetical protein
MNAHSKINLELTDCGPDPIAAQTLAMLEGQRSRLQIALDGLPRIHGHMCRHYLAKVELALEQPHHWQAWRGTFGPNGYGPAIDDAVRAARRVKS